MKARLFNYLFKLYKACLLSTRAKKINIFIYTDSRGFNVISNLGKTPFGTYIQKLSSKYKITYAICPQKFTTIVDFLDFYNTNIQPANYDFVILHCGVVDFSPRPLSNISKVKESKGENPRFKRLFELNEDHYKKHTGIKYYNEDVVTMYSAEYLTQEIGPLIKQIDNLIWIDSNHFVNGWEGNFTKGRPSNIEATVDAYDNEFKNFVKYRISLKDWTAQQIQTYTIDNIHFTKAGFNAIYKKIEDKLNEINPNY